ncbi:hypothetical protein FLA4_01270 [Candidatus Rickettsia kotlanii]|nr:hypothetical protein FLA4_01270 [Candidatus Rickettsia kotlanii]BDU60959.1 hypothetical protein HM2_01270 [Candidatus Rickettsia kotlanii]
MKDTHELLGKNNINYWIDGDTLLGAVRYQGIIPFDNDLDIGIFLQQILPQFKQLGYTVFYERAYNICKKDCLDIFIFHKEQNKFIYTNLAVRNKYLKSSFYDNELYPFKKYTCGSIGVYGPTDPIGNLNRQYPEWDKYAVIEQSCSLFFIEYQEKN